MIWSTYKPSSSNLMIDPVLAGAKRIELDAWGVGAYLQWHAVSPLPHDQTSACDLHMLVERTAHSTVLASPQLPPPQFITACEQRACAQIRIHRSVTSPFLVFLLYGSSVHHSEDRRIERGFRVQTGGKWRREGVVLALPLRSKNGARRTGGPARHR